MLDDNNLVDHNIKLSTMIYILKNALLEIRDCAKTVESARNWAEDALELCNDVKDNQHGC